MLRRVSQQGRVQATRTYTWPASTAGWVNRGDGGPVKIDQAEVLDNYWPRSDATELRGGCEEYADLGSRVTRLFTYTGGISDDVLLGATAEAVWNVDDIAGGDTWPSLEGFVSGEWAITHLANSAGQFIVGVNGSDFGWYFDGTDYNPIADVEVFDLDFDAETAGFTVGQTVTGGSSGANATIAGISKSSDTTGTLKVITVTGTFTDDETITDPVGGSATVNGGGTLPSASTITITGFNTYDLGYVWNFKDRLFFLVHEELKFAYLPVESIGGALTEFDLGSVFREGGYLVFGATWSIGDGADLDAVCVFVTSKGEIAIYSGSDPSSSTTWGLVGVYKMPKPLNNHAHYNSGGELIVATEDGLIPVSAAIKGGGAGMQRYAVSYDIEDAWEHAASAITASAPINLTLWHAESTLIVGTPALDAYDNNTVLIMNTGTGAWARWTGWDVRCCTSSNDDLYFGDGNGKVFLGNSTGQDAGTAFTALWAPRFSDLGAPGTLKHVDYASIIVSAPSSPVTALTMMTDYNVISPTGPSSLLSGGDFATWSGGATWDGGAVWGSSATQTPFRFWKKVSGVGEVISPLLLVTSDQEYKLYFEPRKISIRFSLGSNL